MKKFNPSITKEQIDNICKKVDKDNSGKISLDGKIMKNFDRENLKEN
jgi:hypothetical protein